MEPRKTVSMTDPSQSFSLITSEYITSIREVARKRLKWTHKEKLFKNRKPTYKCDIPLSHAVKMNLKQYPFGIFLKCFNSQQPQNKCFNDNKFGILMNDIKNGSAGGMVYYSPEKYFFKGDTLETLKYLVETKEEIDITYFYENSKELKLIDYEINRFDKHFLKFKCLTALYLPGNWIKTVPGKHLPRTLQVLELHGNAISDVTELSTDGPPKLMFLGLSRNNITNDSNLHTLVNSYRFLLVLDLSENDIYYLVEALETLQTLTTLRCLLLQGNPCSIGIAYKDMVIHYFPHLMNLDGYNIAHRDRGYKKPPRVLTEKAYLIFTGHRVIGLSKPPKGEKNSQQTLHFEIHLPLLEEIRQPQAEITTGISVKPHDSIKSTPKAKTPKAGEKKNPYDAPDEYQIEIASKVRDTSFKSQRIPWSKIIEFPEESIVVESPEGNLINIRDTFRNDVSVSLVYLKFYPPGKSPEQVKEAKARAKAKAKAKSGSNPPPSPEFTETILKKVTLTTFTCSLSSVNWSNKTNDYYWAEHPMIKDTALPVEGSLKAIVYIDPPKRKGKVPPAPPPTAEGPDAFRVPSTQYLPKIFTCQVGFGLRRIHTHI